MTKIFDWKNSEDARDIVHLVVQALVEARLVVLPTETGYHVFASALQPEAVAQLRAQLGDKDLPALFVRSFSEALDFVPQASAVAQRLLRRGWPAPIEVCLPGEQSELSLVAQLPAGVRQLFTHRPAPLGLRGVDHEVIAQTMRLMPGPLIGVALTDAAGHGLTDLSEMGAVWRDSISCAVDDGLPPQPGFATRVFIEENRCRIDRHGVVPQQKVAQLAQFVILCVCTGNTCRSPMAEALFKHTLAQRFANLLHGPFPAFYVASAGLSAFPGGPASPEAVKAMQRRGLNLEEHQSQPLSEHHVRYADAVFTMTQSHRQAILAQMPDCAEKVQLLSPQGSDVHDPFGGTQDQYLKCADQMEHFVRQRVEELEDSLFPVWETTAEPSSDDGI
ncbi:MAG: protein-tyrosine-phosphatase [Pirellulaceae bacterium]|nr:MAG: protein-tyrosine-phosphatase [Pirellulaceae bacterium]